MSRTVCSQLWHEAEGSDDPATRGQTKKEKMQQHQYSVRESRDRSASAVHPELRCDHEPSVMLFCLNNVRDQ